MDATADAQHSADERDELDERKEWDRKDGEPLIWFARFERFRKDGTTRSLTRLYNFYRNSPKKSDNAPMLWREIAKKWDWRARAEAWDEAEIERQRREEKKEREQERRARVTMLQAMRGKVAEAMQGLIPASATWGDVTRALHVVTEQLRTEFGEPPVGANWNVNVDLSQLTDEQIDRLASGENPARVLASAGASRTRATETATGEGAPTATPNSSKS